ncbi:DUF3500 domain-containing protein [Nocardioides terrisoli]|uniref:DUF3500 domain-containing protein n=1 Tax=Nocardioides terrisoli TaxID=3388267 RepID=UPI00287B891E|nr:DUF3500 domain-containing protein [Nocardioides marmorisolisilvae]
MTAATSERTRAAAARWLGLLDDDQRASATYSFDDVERMRWQYTPGPRGGLILGGMTDPQRAAALDLVATGLSDSGWARARAVMDLETVLRAVEQQAGRPGWERRDPGHYWLSVFADPADEVWGWRLGGHHVCVHVSVVGDSVAALPLFLGANPATAPDGTRPLAAEEDAGRALLESLDADQRAVAVVADHAPADIITGNAVRAEVTAVPRGIGYADLDPSQRDLLSRLVGVYTGRPAQTVTSTLDRSTFAWLGSVEPGEGHYYAVRADSLLIELDNTQTGANHVHTVVRDLRRDWGADLLAQHYRDQHR